jgi:hypothetical protein
VTDRPIIFSAPMIHALLEGRKTQTRRILKPQPEHCVVDGEPLPIGLMHIEGEPLPRITVGRVVTRQEIRFVAGDHLWVRETWKPFSIYAERAPRDIPRSKVFYRADEAYGPSNTKWVLPIHMPRWASRLTLIVESVKVERLQAMNRGDAMEEGCPFPNMANGENPIDWFRALWTAIHGAGSWDHNPFVAAISFRVVKASTDTLAKDAP